MLAIECPALEPPSHASLKNRNATISRGCWGGSNAQRGKAAGSLGSKHRQCPRDSFRTQKRQDYSGQNACLSSQNT